MKARVAVTLLAIFFGLVAAITIVMYMNNMRVKVKDQTSQVKVLAAKDTLPLGLSLDELKARQLVEEKDLPKSFLPAGSLSGSAKLEGMVVSSPVGKGEIITAGNFSTPETKNLSYKTPAGLVGLAIPAINENAVGNHIRVGDFVNVIVSKPSAATANRSVKTMVTETVLFNVQVLAYGSVAKRETTEEKKTGASKPASDRENKTVTLAVTQEQAVKLVSWIEADGKAWLTLVSSPDAPAPKVDDVAVVK